MRLFPVLAALVVSALFYGLMFERERFLALLPATGPGEEADGPPADTAAADTAAADGRAAADDVMTVVVQRSASRRIDTAVTLRGRTEADRQVDLRAETSGRVISDPLRKGAMIAAGQELCRLDPAARQASLQEARARLTEARARVPEAEARLQEAQARQQEAEINANAAQKLSQDGFASQSRVAATRAALSSARAAVQSARSGLEQAQSGIQGARAAVAAAEEEIRRLTITAPFEGVLETDTAELGSLLQPGALCATVIQLDPIVLVGFVSELQVDRVTAGARAEARVASGRQAEGAVTFLSRAADPTTRTFRVEIEVPNPDLRLRDGQSAEITIGAEGVRAHLLPPSALTLDDAGTLGVRLVSDEDLVQFSAVRLVRDTQQGVWLAGLPDAARVIVVGQEYVTDGVRVRVTEREMGQ